MDREFLKKHKLMESHKQFMRLCNEGYLSEIMTEDDPNNDPNAMGGTPDGNSDPNAMDGNPNAMGGAPNGMGDPNAMGADPNAMGGAPDGNSDPNAMGGAPDGNGGPDEMGEDPNMMDGTPDDMGGMPDDMGDDMNDEPENDNTVIDVEDITSAQEKLNHKENEIGKDLGSVDNRIEKLMTAIETMKSMIDHNNSDISTLKSELEKRIPTQTERLAMQSLHAYPYNVDPNEYWEKKENEGVYQATDGGTQKTPYEITLDKIKDYNDSDMELSLDNPELRQSMKDIFKGI